MNKRKIIFIVLFSLILLICIITCIIAYNSTPTNNTALQAYNTVKSDLKYDVIYPFYKGRALVKKDGKFGYIDTKGKEVVPLIYDRSGYGYFDLIDMAKSDSKYIVRNNRKFVVEITDEKDKRLDLIDHNNWRWVEKDGKEGIIDADGYVVIPIEYDVVGGYITVWPNEYTDASGIIDVGFYDGLLKVLKNKKWGFIDIANNVVIPLEYDYVWDFNEGVALVEKDGKEGYIDTHGAIVTPFIYDSLSIFSGDGLLIAMLNEKWGVCDTDGNVVLPIEYDNVGYLTNGFAHVEKDGKHGYIDSHGQEAISLEYEDARDFSQGFAAVKRNGKWGFIDAKGNTVVPLEYDFSRDFNNEEITSIEVNGKWGFINTSGAMIIPPEYDSVGAFTEGLARVENNGVYGYINKAGDIIIPLEYDSYGFNICEGLIPICKDGKSGFADTAGNVVIPIEYTYYKDFKNNETIVGKNDKYGVIDKQGREILPIQYDWVSKCDGYDDGYIAVQSGGTWQILKKK
ncbi:MAG: WG repeat-containing protein [Peptococcaceae bacterium]|nr:WG repeat-containing protein [Peptococcaceae bacterium]